MRLIPQTSGTALTKLASQTVQMFPGNDSLECFLSPCVFPVGTNFRFLEEKPSSNLILYYTFTLTLKPKIMSIVKVIEVIASSEKSFDDAVQNALTEASKSVKNIDSIYVKHFKAKVEDNRVVSYGVNAKISFKVNSRDID